MDTLSINIRVIPFTSPIIEFTQVIEKVNVDTKVSIPALFSATEAAIATWSLEVSGSSTEESLIDYMLLVIL